VPQSLLGMCYSYSPSDMIGAYKSQQRLSHHVPLNSCAAGFCFWFKSIQRRRIIFNIVEKLFNPSNTVKNRAEGSGCLKGGTDEECFSPFHQSKIRAMFLNSVPLLCFSLFPIRASTLLVACSHVIAFPECKRTG